MSNIILEDLITAIKEFHEKGGVFTTNNGTSHPIVGFVNINNEKKGFGIKFLINEKNIKYLYLSEAVKLVKEKIAKKETKLSAKEVKDRVCPNQGCTACFFLSILVEKGFAEYEYPRSEENKGKRLKSDVSLGD